MNTNAQCDLPSIPILYLQPTNMLSQNFYAIYSNGQSFTLYSSDDEIGSYDLPIYNDGWGKYEKAVFTPISVTADLTIVCGIIGYFYLQGVAEDYSNPIHGYGYRPF
ncbi:MAG TPA: hypothetical protein VFV23_11600 [Verrucomicrobiae bacterium]|nr:hypothetical protein [Verrucomicrobiae bacterium]